MKMWPVILNMTRDDCRRTLRSLELEAYSNMISVFRAQGPLEDTRKKLLEDLRGVLHISNDRHGAEARRVANDEILATIAEQLVGPNTGQTWVSEGRRRVPLMPRGIPQTAFTEIADQVAKAVALENKELLKKIEAEKLAPQVVEEEIPERSKPEMNDTSDELLYPPIVTEDLSVKLWNAELNRKRKLTETESAVEEVITPAKSRNIVLSTTQKYLNVGNLYKISQPATCKASGHSKHSYNQVSKVSTSKSHPNQQTSERRNKHRAYKNSKNPSQIVRSKKSQEAMLSPKHSAISPQHDYAISPQHDYAISPGSFQATYAQSLIVNKPKMDYLEDAKGNTPTLIAGGPLSPPVEVPHELGMQAHEPTSLNAQVPNLPKLTSKPCQLVIKKKGNIALDRTVQMSDLKMLQKPTENVKITSNRQVLVTSNAAPKLLNTSGKLVTTKIIGSASKPQNTPTILSDKMIVMSKSDHRGLPASRILNFTTTASINKDSITVTNSHVSTKTTDSIVAKCIPATDVKVSAKTFLLNPKSGQKMVVLPNKTKTTTELPMLHFKGISTAMKIVPVSTQSVMKPAITKSSIVNVPLMSPKIIGMEPIKTANMADITPVKGILPMSPTPKPSPIIRPSTGKGGVIVVQKGATICKTLSFPKNCNDVSKIIMGKNMNQLLQASNIHKQEQEGKPSSNSVIVLELNNDQTAQATTMSRILEAHESTGAKVAHNDLSEDTQNLYENADVDETACTSSLDSATESMDESTALEETELLADKADDANKDPDSAKDTSSVTDWEMELDSVSRKDKDDDDKLNSDQHVDLGMSSGSDAEYTVSGHKPKSKTSPKQSIEPAIITGMNTEIYVGSPSLTHTSRTLLSQLQDEGSSSNDSSFTLNKSNINTENLKDDIKMDTVEDKEVEALNKAKETLSEKVAEEKSQQKRMDIYSAAISSSDINLDSFPYLEDSMIEDDMFGDDSEGKIRDSGKELDLQLSQLLAEAADSSDALSLSKQ